MASAALGPSKDSFLTVFLDSNFRTSFVPPPEGTSLQGQTAIVTGSNGGIGLAAVELFLSLGLSHAIIAVRTISKGEDAAGPLREKFAEAKIDVWPLDMLSYDSVQEFAKKCETLQRLDIAILNAGIAPTKYQKSTSTGHEEALQVNYLSTVLLSILLLPILKEKSPADTPGRLSIVCSGLALRSQFPERNEDPLLPALDKQKEWSFPDVQERYNVTKTLQIMFLEKVAEYVDSKDVIINAVEPGLTKGSSLHKEIPMFVKPFIWAFHGIAARTTDQAAYMYANAAITQGRESHGGLVMNFKIYPQVERSRGIRLTISR